MKETTFPIAGKYFGSEEKHDVELDHVVYLYGVLRKVNGMTHNATLQDALDAYKDIKHALHEARTSQKRAS